MKIEQRYGVYILQATGEPLEVKDSGSFEECKKIFDKLELDLEKARKTKGALFKIRDPWIFSCDPNFILRITVIPKKVPKAANSDNPYQKRMEQVGLSSTLKNLSGSDITDEGYTTD